MAKTTISPKCWTVYCLKNITNSKCYVGITSRSLNYRWRRHIYDSGRSYKPYRLLLIAIRKYGPDAFTQSVLCTAESEQEAYEIEKCFIHELNSQGPTGYNMTPGGEGALAALLSEKAKAKRRARAIGKPLLARHRLNLGKAQAKRNNYLPGAVANGQQWKARIYSNGRYKNLGNFRTPEEASAAYLEALEAHLYPPEPCD